MEFIRPLHLNFPLLCWVSRCAHAFFCSHAKLFLVELWIRCILSSLLFENNMQTRFNCFILHWYLFLTMGSWETKNRDLEFSSVAFKSRTILMWIALDYYSDMCSYQIKSDFCVQDTNLVVSEFEIIILWYTCSWHVDPGHKFIMFVLSFYVILRAQ